MGYEIKMYIVEPTSSDATCEFIGDSGDWFHCWRDEYSSPYHYSNGGSAKKYISPLNKIVIRKPCVVIAMVDLCKAGVTSFPKRDTDYYFYETDGNTPVIEDRYGDFLQEAPLEVVIDWLEQKIESGSISRRYKTALALAKGCVGLYDKPTVLIYGY